MVFYGFFGDGEGRYADLVGIAAGVYEGVGGCAGEYPAAGGDDTEAGFWFVVAVSDKWGEEV